MIFFFLDHCIPHSESYSCFLMFKAVFPAPLRLQSAGHHMCVKDLAVSKAAIATIFDYHLTAL